ncbi:MAG TPA: HD domain-containing protein [Acidimicrobiales bacterium]|nr:HD domain-containing protein [Acidimicrobiales bacterium]
MAITEQESELSARALEWASTMDGVRAPSEGVRRAHDQAPPAGVFAVFDRCEREEAEAAWLAPGGTQARGAGRRATEEEPDEVRTCFERDRDRILHSAAFRRLAGKTQVFVFPADHQRTRLTHALEVAQVATAIARASRLNVALCEAIALGHDCGHGPGGHASEDALSPFLAGGFDHAVWGADVTFAPLNLCAETLDGIRNHSWSRPAPSTPEGEVVALADRIAYTAHDLEDAAHAGIVDLAELPAEIVERCGRTRSAQLRAFVRDVVEVSSATGQVALSESMGETLAALRRFDYERIYLRPASTEQSKRVVDMLRCLVEHYAAHPAEMPADHSLAETTVEGRSALALRLAVGYVAGMTDRFACVQAVARLGWTADRLPRGFDSG